MTVRTTEEIGKLLRETAFVAKCDYEKYRDELELPVVINSYSGAELKQIFSGYINKQSA